MAKPSIFSRDYEKKMKRRKRRIILTIVLILVVGIGVLLKFKLDDIDFSNLKNKIQAWVDSDKPKEEIEEKKEDNIVVEEEKKEDIIEEEKYIDFNLENNGILKAEYIEENNLKEFTKIEPSSNINNLEYDISPMKDKIIIKDKNQNLYLCDLDGNVKNITKTSYTSGAGDVFLKDDILARDANYIWHSQIKFIDNSNIVYVSSLPYFGASAVSRYLWIYNVDNSTENCLWNYTGAEIVFGNIVMDKGLEVKIDGTQYYLNSSGSLIQ